MISFCVITCNRLLMFQYVFNKIVHQLNTGLLGRFVRGILLRLEQLSSCHTEVRSVHTTPVVKPQTASETMTNKNNSHFGEAARTSRSLNLYMLQPEMKSK